MAHLFQFGGVNYIAIALAGAIAIGPRIGRLNKDGSANPILGHNVPMGILGTIILFFGWFGFNPGSALGIQGAFINLVALAAVNALHGANLLRVSAADEVAGLDLPEMGLPGYHGDGAYLPEAGRSVSGGATASAD